ELTGTFFGTVDFDPDAGTANLTSTGVDAFVLALDAGGAFRWAGRIGGTQNDNVAGIARAPSGHLLVAGSFFGTADLDPGPGVASVTSAGTSDGFLVDLDASGAFVRGFGFGGPGSDEADAVAAGPGGDVYLTGTFTNTVDFDPGPGSFTYSSRALSRDAFLLALGSGGGFRWAAQLGGPANDAGLALATGGPSGVHLAGTFAGTADFDPGVPAANRTSNGFDDFFALRLVDAFASPVVRHVPADFGTIQAAIDAARQLDTIRVAPGVYAERLDFHGQRVAVESEGGAAVTTLDGGGAGPVVTFTQGEDANAKLSGFTIRNGVSALDGGGVLIQAFSSPVIRDNEIRDNQAGASGAGITIRGGAPVIANNRIAGNRQIEGGQGGGGGGIAVFGGSPRIEGNTIENNEWKSPGSHGGGILLFGSTSSSNVPLLLRNRIRGNVGDSGGGLGEINAIDPILFDNLITGNQAAQGGGAYWLVPNATLGPYLLNNTLADNAAPLGSEILADGFQSQTVLANNVLRALPGRTAVHCGGFTGATPPQLEANNVYAAGGIAYEGICSDPGGLSRSADPLFVDAAHGDYRLWPASPSVDAGDDAALLPGADFALDFSGAPRRLDEPETSDTGAGAPPVVDQGAFESGRGLAYFTLSPCRLIDTRSGSPLASGLAEIRAAAGSCGIPPTARALAVNATVIGPTGDGFLALYPGDGSPPAASAVNFRAGQTRTNNAVVSAARNGAGTLALRAFVAASGTVDVVIDVFGYFE
ncbi:MAG TPA: right-handed parallel beta-helix repeat-containing protein, partial [Thermoanaerobaculia bacterium]|nr:right-handed parallel beta-helix repeat-containing protein [Thermoanaerobaculia bacterium]